MKNIEFIFTFSLSLFIIIQCSTPILFDSSGTGFTLSDNIVTINIDGDYNLVGSYKNKQIKILSKITLNLNSFSLINEKELTPIIIGTNQEVEIILSGESTLEDSIYNRNEGVIYLQSGATLTISGTGTLNLCPYKLMGINGTEETSLIVNDGATIKINSDDSMGGIYLRKGITFNNAKYLYFCSNGEYHAIDTEGNIQIIKGTYNIISGDGKGIQAEKNIYIGEENGDNSNLKINIETSNKGIEAMGIIIYSGNINIKALEDGINAASSGEECDEEVICHGNCKCYIKINGGHLTLISEEDALNADGDITITGGNIVIFTTLNTDDQSILQDGLLQINGGNIIAASFSQIEGGIKAKTTQIEKTYRGNISSGSNLVVYDESNKKLLSLKTLKKSNYIYFNFPEHFIVKIDNKKITLLDPIENEKEDGLARHLNIKENPGYYLKSWCNILIICSIILFSFCMLFLIK